MSEADFNALYDQVTQQIGDWRQALVDAWGCLFEDQKQLLDAAT